jgi:hypothetical protein
MHSEVGGVPYVVGVPGRLVGDTRRRPSGGQLTRPDTFSGSEVEAALPHAGRSEGAGSPRPSPWPAPVAERPSLRLRLRVALERDALDRALAGGAQATASSELAFRAARLMRERNCRGLARCLRLTVWEAEAGVSASRVTPRPVRRAEVLSARDALLSLAERLESAPPESPEGVAITERLLNDLRSPVFAWAEPGTVRRLAHLAVAAMDPPLPRQDGGAC